MHVEGNRKISDLLIHYIEHPDLYMGDILVVPETGRTKRLVKIFRTTARHLKDKGFNKLKVCRIFAYALTNPSFTDKSLSDYLGYQFMLDDFDDYQSWIEELKSIQAASNNRSTLLSQLMRKLGI